MILIRVVTFKLPRLINGEMRDQLVALPSEHLVKVNLMMLSYLLPYVLQSF